jgi:hypothetical protein
MRCFIAIALAFSAARSEVARPRLGQPYNRVQWFCTDWVNIATMPAGVQQ